MKILNLNIWNQNYFWEKRLPIIVNLLKKHGFTGEADDVLVFQEVKNSPEHNQLEELNAELGYKNKIFFQAQKGSGIGVLTNLRVVRRKLFRLKRDRSDPDDYFPRIVGLVELGKGLILGVTHFSVSSEAQVRNAKDCMGHIEGFNKRNWPVVVCADLNCGPGEKPYEVFIDEDFVDVWKGLDLKEFDSWPVDRELVIENHKMKHGEEPSWEIKGRRMDFVFVKGLTAKSAEKVGGKVGGVWHSDHWGVEVEVASDLA